MPDPVPSIATAPIIVSALLGSQDFAWLDGLRRAHFPPERNVIPAHLTLFHHLPPSIGAELRQRLAAVTRCKPPPAVASGLLNLGRGVAIRIESPQLKDVRAELADGLAGLLGPQDQAGWRPHVTIQNKVEPVRAKALLLALEKEFRPRAIQISGLAAWWYRGGPWELISQHAFRS